MAGFRNVLVHNYLNGIDLEQTWNIVQSYLPRACHQLRARSLIQWGIHALSKQKRLGAETVTKRGFEV
ncbi:MAG: HepT-like ribonuclease domain-containing protein [Cyanophyceae cyanobacterium]